MLNTCTTVLKTFKKRAISVFKELIEKVSAIAIIPGQYSKKAYIKNCAPYRSRCSCFGLYFKYLKVFLKTPGANTMKKDA